ncbi:MAG TPA: hypothetical protein VFX65_03930 [Candidatus Limnocylindrales bacterium]|nr:hypothetical protein [Candidatus Limnocylindrales bacterium]
MTDAGQELRVASDGLLRDLDELAKLEDRKRTLEPDDATRVRLAAEIEALAVRVLDYTSRQKALATEILRDPETSAVEGTIAETPRSMAMILQAWRDAERRLAAAVPGSPEHSVALREVEQYREEYRRAYEARGKR